MKIRRNFTLISFDSGDSDTGNHLMTMILNDDNNYTTELPASNGGHQTTSNRPVLFGIHGIYCHREAPRLNSMGSFLAIAER